MELRDIEYFGVVAEHRHLGRAAEALGLTQPALSKCLRRLETALEAKLVRRTPTGVELTAEGAALASHVRGLRLSLDDIAREVRDVTHGRVGHLRIGAAPGMAERVLPAPCNALLKDAPQVTFKVTAGNNDVLLPALRHGELDLVVAGIPDLPYEDLVQERLYDDEFAVFASASHRLASRTKVTIADLARERWAAAASNVLAWQWLQQAFEKRGLPPPRIALEASGISLRQAIAASSELLCFNARRNVEDDTSRLPLVALPIRELRWLRHVGMSYRKGAYLSPLARRFIDLLKSTTREIDKA